jgi:hypothetical protein
LSRELVDAVIDELVPTSERGKFGIGRFEDIICEPADDCMGSSANYQNVAIYYNSSVNKDGSHTLLCGGRNDHPAILTHVCEEPSAALIPAPVPGTAHFN